jgi:sporulation protein YlmC with PRC-barrel domain
VKPSDPMRLVSQVRDLQIVDADGVHCGIVDDIELEGKPGGALRVKALVVGPGGYAKRLPGWWLALVRLVAGNGTVRVPWSEVEHITSRVRLGSTAAKLGLGRAEARAARLLPKIGGIS